MKQPSAHVANMEFAEDLDDETSVLQNDDIEAEKKDEPLVHLIPGYANFDDYLQVRLLVRVDISSPRIRSFM